MAERRILDQKAAAEYCGYTSAHRFDEWARKTLGVRPLPDRPGKYDRKALDRALDRLSGLVADVDDWFNRRAG